MDHFFKGSTQLFMRQPHKTVTLKQLLLRTNFLSTFDHFLGLALEVYKYFSKYPHKIFISLNPSGFLFSRQ